MTDEWVLKPLSIEVIQSRNKLLRELLLDFRTPLNYEDCFQNIIERLEIIYQDDYRHMYSEIEAISAQMKPSERETVAQNMESLRNMMIDKWGEYPEHLYGSVLKLSDHVSLEIQRGASRENKEKEIEQSYEKISIDLKKAKLKIKKMQTQNTTILAIFASIVVGFTGGITFLNTSIGSLSDSTPPQQLFIISMCSFVLFNTVFIMLTYTRGMIDDLSDDKKQFLDSIKRNWMFIMTDVILIIMIVIGYGTANGCFDSI